MSHIALLLPDLEVGGAQRAMLLLAKEFSSRGHQVDMVVLQASGPCRTHDEYRRKVSRVSGRFESVEQETRVSVVSPPNLAFEE